MTAFNNIEQIFLIKQLSGKNNSRKRICNLIKVRRQKLTANITVKKDNLDAFLVETGTRTCTIIVTFDIRKKTGKITSNVRLEKKR